MTNRIIKQEVKERPILMNSAMVRATLNGSKTHTRRLVKHQPLGNEFIRTGLYHPTIVDRKGEMRPGAEIFGAYTQDGEWAIPCPFGEVGDQLWVRESFWCCDLPGYGDAPCVVYDDEWHGKEYMPAEVRPWGRKFGRIPSIHMPRDCSRIQLEITSVRVERLQKISDSDILAEGIDLELMAEMQDKYDIVCAGTDSDGRATLKSMWRDLWLSTGGDWDANPFVWVIEFKRVNP